MKMSLIMRSLPRRPPARRPQRPLGVAVLRSSGAAVLMAEFAADALPVPLEMMIAADTEQVQDDSSGGRPNQAHG
jgi:hypothetical protein